MKFPGGSHCLQKRRHEEPDGGRYFFHPHPHGHGIPRVPSTLFLPGPLLPPPTPAALSTSIGTPNSLSVEGGTLVVEGACGVMGNAGCLLPAEPEVLEQTFEMSAELDPNKNVEHRVEAAVGEGNVAADEQGIIQLLAELAALDDPKFQKCLQKQDQVVGSPAEKVGCHNGEDEPDCTGPPFGP